MLKDFIRLNSPCFACNAKTTLTFNGFYKCYVGETETSIKLKIKYNKSITLNISHKDNIFSSNNITELNKFLSKEEIFLSIQCSKCGSFISSKNLSLNFTTFRLDPIFIDHEYFILKNDAINLFVMICSDVINNNVTATFFENNGLVGKVINLPFFNIVKFKDKQKLLKKIELYNTFS